MRLERIIEAKEVARVHARMASNAFVIHRRKNLEARPGIEGSCPNQPAREGPYRG